MFSAGGLDDTFKKNIKAHNCIILKNEDLTAFKTKILWIKDRFQNIEYLKWLFTCTCTIYSTQYKQQYGLDLITLVHTYLPWAGFELRSLGPEAGLLLPIDLPLLVRFRKGLIIVLYNYYDYECKGVLRILHINQNVDPKFSDVLTGFASRGGVINNIQ